jgi:hypothetical protein
MVSGERVEMGNERCCARRERDTLGGVRPARTSCSTRRGCNRYAAAMHFRVAARSLGCGRNLRRAYLTPEWFLYRADDLSFRP